MKINFKLFFILVGLTVIFSSCRTSAPRLDYQALARASVLLGIDINLEDDHKLYLEAADWIGAPYRGGGDSEKRDRLFRHGLSNLSESISYPSATKHRRTEE